jgi:hypothetical protein
MKVQCLVLVICYAGAGPIVCCYTALAEAALLHIVCAVAEFCTAEYEAV